ncbi:hypothetical protein [Streptosporangium sp. NPDC023615]|uniref:hypothetical protein n=1 Tax=Streptosporangium sp. NPDC023615 TaxID=3154794 RepID=UPI003413E8C3
MRDLARATLCVIAACALAAGCGAEKEPKSTAAPPAKPSTTAPVVFAAPGTVLAMRCYQLEWQLPPTLLLQAISVNDGKITSQTSVQLPENAKGTEWCRGRYAGPLVRQLFDRDFRHLAVTMADPATGGRRVMALRLADGAVVPQLPQATDDFSSATNETDPFFHPATGELWFRDEETKQLKSRDLKNGQTTIRHTFRESSSGVAVPHSSGFWLTRWTQADSTLVSPDGQRAIEGDFNGRYLALRDQPQAEWRSLDGSVVREELSGPVVPCTYPALWLSSHTLLCAYDGGGQFSTMTFSDNGKRVTESKPAILPHTDRRNYAPVASPDGEKIAFVSTQGTQVALFEVPLNGPAEPRKIADLPPPPGMKSDQAALIVPDPVLLGWN